MHILHIISTISPEAGGVSDFVRTLVEYAPPGYTSEVLCQDDPAAPWLVDFPCPIHALGPMPTIYDYGRNPHLLAWLKTNRSRFDGVMLNGLWVYVGYATWKALAGHKPYLVFSHGMLDPYFKKAYPLKHMKKWVYWLLVEYWVLRNSYRMLFTTEAESKLAEETFWLHSWNGVVVPFGANPPPKDATTLREAFYAAFPALRGKRLMLFLGRIHRKKGCDMLIDAFCRLAPLDPGLHLVMVGPDQQGWIPELSQTVSAAGLTDRVHWPGMIEGDVKWGAFFASEVFILPSHQENFGIAVAEAMACGLPVLLADKVNIAPDIAAHGAGLMVPDTQSGTDQLLRQWIAMPPADRVAMATRALALFNDRYDIRKATATIFHLFDAAVAPKS